MTGGGGRTDTSFDTQKSQPLSTDFLAIGINPIKVSGARAAAAAATYRHGRVGGAGFPPPAAQGLAGRTWVSMSLSCSQHRLP